MDIEKIYEDLEKKMDTSKILKNESMKKHTSFKIGGNADIFVKADTIEEVKNVKEIAEANKIPLHIIGNGSNILVKDSGIEGIVLSVGIKGIEIEEKENCAKITVGAGVKLAYLAQEFLKKGIQGFEFASRDTRNNWWCCTNECRSTWQGNERYYFNDNLYG